MQHLGLQYIHARTHLGLSCVMDRCIMHRSILSGAQIGGAGRQRRRQGYYAYMDSRLWLPAAWVCLVMNLAKEGAWLRMLPRLSISNA